MDMDKYQEYIEKATEWAIGFGPKLLLALVILIVGFWIVKRIVAFSGKAMKKANVSPEVFSFLGSILGIGLKIVVLLIAAGTMGFEMTSLIGILAAIGFAVGLALQGFLGNFASGITIVFFKPYRVGDWVEISEKFGKVTDIQIFSTTIITPGKKVHIIPNGQVTDNIITNFSTEKHIRLELIVTMPYAEDFPKVKRVITESLKGCPFIVQDLEPEIGIEGFDSHSINVAVRPYINADDYWDATFDCYQRIKQAFSEHDIQVAYSEGVELGKVGK